MIRSQQTQLQHLQQQQSQPSSGTAIIDDATISSERSASLSQPVAHPPPSSHRLSISSLSNRPLSQSASPNLRPQDGLRGPEGVEAFPALRDSSSRRGSRDESAFYQAEATMLGRENQMLRQRIRELGKQFQVIATNSLMRSLWRSSPLRRKHGRSYRRHTYANIPQNDSLET